MMVALEPGKLFAVHRNSSRWVEGQHEVVAMLFPFEWLVKKTISHSIHGTNGIFNLHEWLIFIVFM